LNAPSNLVASPLSSSQIKLTWTDNSSDEQYFYIERKTGASGTYYGVATVYDNTTTYTDSYLTQNTEYYYRVRAYNGGGYSSPYSNEAGATTPPLTLNAPSNLTATALSSSQIKLTWTDNSSDEQYFYIERKTGASGTYYGVATVYDNTTTYTDSYLTQNTEYYYRVRAYNGGGYSPYSNEAAATTPPLTLNAPSNLTATVLSPYQVKLTWTDNSSEEDRFYIERKTGASGNYSTLTFLYGSTTTYTDTSASDNTEYYYRVRAYNYDGVYSEYSNEAGATTPTLPLNAPSNLTATSLPSCEIKLTWSDNSSETGFFIERKTGASGTYSYLTSVGVNVTTYTDFSVSDNTVYYYRVRAYKGDAYSSYSNEAGATTPIMAFQAPSNLTATALSSSQIRLTWTDNSAEEKRFYIERKEGASGTYYYLTYVYANTTTYTDYNLPPNTEYYYRVRAYGDGGYSPYSNGAGAATLPLNAPSNLTATVLSYSQIKLTWTDNSSDEQYFHIERKTGASGTYSYLTDVYANATTYTDTSALHNTEYYYRVRAYNGGGYSAYSNEADATTPLLILDAPSDLTATALSSCQINLTWTDNSSDEQYFIIERKTGASGTYSTIANYLGANTTTYTDYSLAHNMEYYYRVRAYGAGAYSPYSNDADATTLTLKAPSTLTATALSSSQVKLTWADNSSDEQYFIIERKTGASGTYSTIADYVNANTRTYTDTSASQNTEYYYRVRAYNGCGYSASSNEAGATTPPLTLNAPSNLTASPLSYSQIKLTWTDNSSNETRFYIERKTGASGTYSQVTYVGANATTYTDYNLKQNTEYYYRVRAYGAGIYSAYSNEVSATTLSLNAPSDLTAEPMSCSEMKLTWKDNTTDEWYFYIEYKMEGETYWHETYVYGNTTTYTHTGLIPGKKYYYRVRAYSYYNYSPYSNEASGTTVLPEGYELYSKKIALVPGAGGRYNYGGTLPASFTCYVPAFVNVSVESIRDNATDPLVTGGYDTVVLVGICDINNFLSNNRFKSRIENFVSYGGKLIIWDSECRGTDYLKFVFPFITSNPGQMGSTGVLTDREENTLSSKDTLSDNYINVSYVSSQTTAVGDSNVLVTQDPNWCIDMTAENYNGVTGPVHTYAQYGQGLIIYDGFDKTDMYTGQKIGTANGVQNLGKIWMLELKQPWNPVPEDPETGNSVLPCLVPVVGIQLTPESATIPINKYHTLEARVVDQTGNPVSGVTVTFTVKSGPHAGTGGTGVTDTSGVAAFSYKGIYAGEDSIEASATVNGSAVKSKTVKGEWIFALTDVRVIDTISNTNITVDELSISPTPYSISQAGDAVVIEWRYPYISIGEIQDLSLYVDLLNPIPGEDRLVNQKLSIYYTDVNGNPVMTELGPQYVHVLTSAFEGSITTDKPEYQSNENVLISGSIKSLSEYEKTLDAKVRIEDSNGALVKEVSALTALNFPIRETKNFSDLVFNIGSTYAGSYRAHLILYDNQKQTAEAFADFTILPSKVVTSSVTTDKATYGSNEQVTITSQIRNASPNYAFRDLRAKISLLDTQGQVLFTDSKTISVIMPGGFTTFESYWKTAATSKGKYTVSLEVFEGASVVSTSQTVFDILGTSQTAVGLVGTIVAQPNPVYQGKSETLTYSIKNTGNEDISNLAVKVLVVDPDNGVVMHTFETTVNLNMAATISGDSVASTLNMSPKTYIAALQASTSDMVKQKTLSTATFVVKSPLEAITGMIAANSDPVSQGEDEILFYSITNSGPGDIAGLKVIVPVIDPDTQEVKNTFETVVDIQANTTITGDFTFATTGLTPKTYTADLTVSMTYLTETKTLASDNFEVEKAPLEITKTIPDKMRVLVWLNYQWESGQDCPDRALIEQALKDAGVSYHIVLDKKDFNDELKNPWYTDIMILGTHNPIEDHISEELREHVNSGTGLIASMLYRQDLDEEVFGINYINALSGRDYAVELVAGELWGAGTFQAYGRALDVEAMNSLDVAGWVVEIDNKGTFMHPGIVTNTFGLGKVLYYAFDLGMSTTDYNAFASVLNTSLQYAHRPEEMDSFLPSRMVPVEITVKSLGSAFDLRIAETYPAEVRLYDPSTGQWITANSWVSDIHIEPDETATMLYYALIPEVPGTYELKTEVQYADGGTYSLYQDLYANLVVEKNTTTISGDIIVALQALTVTDQDEVKVANAIKSLQDVMDRAVATKTDIEQNIRDILKAADSLRAVTGTDMSSILLMIDDLLGVWESRWYYFEAGRSYG
jgi:titin